MNARYRRLIKVIAVIGIGFASVWITLEKIVPKIVTLPLGRVPFLMSIEKIDHSVRTALPEGTPVEKVLEFFSQNNVEHSYHAPTKRVYAIIRHIRGSFPPVGKSAQIFITIDEEDRVSLVEIRPVFTGP